MITEKSFGVVKLINDCKNESIDSLIKKIEGFAVDYGKYIPTDELLDFLDLIKKQDGEWVAIK